MKKVFLFVAVLAAFASCKKDHTCTCTTTGSVTPDITTYPKSTKAAARAHCLSYTDTTSTTTCTLN